MRNIILIVKPTHKCNLNCPYCYDKINRINELHGDYMSLKTVEKIAEIFKDNAKQWIWHGGEPLLMGTGFYYKANDIILSKSKDIEMSVQTNGTLINPDYIELFKKYNLRPGLAFDGIKNELTRKHTANFLKTIKLLETYDMPRGAIMLLTPENIDGIIDEHEYFNRLNIPVQMNIIYEAIGNENAKTIGVKQLTNAICNFFDYWMEDNKDSQICTIYLNRLLGGKKSFCGDIDCVGKWFGIHPNGDLMPCGNDWQEDMTFGNIHDYNSTAEIMEHPNFVRFKKETRELIQSCKDNGCPFFYACHGGCYAHAYNKFGHCRKPSPEDCEATKIILTHIYNRIKNIDIYTRGHNYNPYFIGVLRDTGFRPLDLAKAYEKFEIREE